MPLRSLWYDRWINTAVMFGVLCAAAVLTGALLVGDSMRGSLKALTLDRLGNIDTILFAPYFIEYPKSGGHTPPGNTEGVILLPAATEFNGKVGGIQLLARAGAACIANQALADAVGLQPGDTLSLRLMPPQAIPPESSLGRKDQLLRFRMPFPVEEVIPNRGIGRFSLKMDQQAEPLLIVPLEWLQARLDVGDKVNAVFFKTGTPPTFAPTLDDLGIDVEEHDGKWYIRSTRMLFNDEQAEAIQNSLAGTPGLLYLATAIRANDRETPYSTVYACESLTLAPNEIALNQWTADDLAVQIGDEIELTWFDPHDTAITHTKTFTLAKILPMEGLGCDPHLVPTVEGFTDEASIADWDPPFPFDAKKIRKKDEDYWDKYKAAPKAFVSLATGQKLFGSRFGKVTTFVVNESRGRNEMERPDQPDEQSGHSAALRSRFSLETFNITLVPVKAQGLAASAGTTPFSVLFLAFSFFIIASALMLVMMLFRLSVEMKAKRIGIQLAVGLSSAFVTKTLLIEGLFLSLLGSLTGTFFGIFYAWLMVYGLTTWWVDAVTVPFLTLHINPVSLVIGFASGVGLAMLTIIWSVRGVTKVPLRALLHGIVIAPIHESRERNEMERPDQPGKQSGRSALLRFRIPLPKDTAQRSPRTGWKKYEMVIAHCVFFSSLILLLYGRIGSGLALSFSPSHFVLFFVTGTSVLLYGFVLYGQAHYRPRLTESASIASPLSFAQSSIARNPNRSLLCVALVASTTFLVLSISAFHLEPKTESNIFYMGETMFSVYADISTAEGRERLGMQPDDEAFLTSYLFASVGACCEPLGLKKTTSPQEKNSSLFWATWNIMSFRMRDGDSTSCLNLFQTGNPRILGAPRKIIQFGYGLDHAWFPMGESVGLLPEEENRLATLWRPITIDPDGVRRVPVMIDQNTAMYALHLYGGIGDVYELDIGNGETIRCEIVGLPSNSFIQGEIIMSEENLLQLFPEVGGYRYFLFPIHSGVPADTKERMIRIIYDLLGDYGFQGEPTSDRLRKLFAVQNTYLSTFQSLGGIGLLLGIFGLAVIQSRNVLERRKELALLQAVGFTKFRVILLLLYESFTLLAWGLGLAVVASAFALLPFLIGGVEQISPMSVLRQFVVLVGSLLAVGVVSNVAAALAVLKIPVARELAEER